MSPVNADAGSLATPVRPGHGALFLKNRLAAIAASLLAVIVLIVLLAPLLPLHDPDVTAPANRLLRPLADGHLLGSDQLGRDMLSRLLHGTRTSLAVGLSATLVAAVLGSAIGLIAGYAGGRTDNMVMRGIDMIMGFPYILLALAIVAALGPSLINALYAIAIVNIPFFARNIRGVTIGLVHREFVDAARLSGKNDLQILGGEILPGVLPTIVITMSTTVGWMILETAGLSFLGLGAQPPQADLGSMLGEGRKLLFTAPHVSIIPGLMIFVLVMGINLTGDGIRDVLDPRLKSGALASPSARTAVLKDRPKPAVSPQGDGDIAPRLAVRGLRTRFETGARDYDAVVGVDFDLGPRQCLGLIGESGSGKSVTAMSLMGLVPTPAGRIVAGRVDYDGTDLLDVPDDRLRALRGDAVAYVFQDPLSSLHPLFTVGDQLIEAIRAHRPLSYGEAREQARALLEQVRMPNARQRLDAYPHELSGGMRQRVCIAMALCNDPEILIADEPTTALDVTVQAQMLALLNRLRIERDAAVLFITHDFGVISELCDHVAVMYAGRIVEAGRTAEILAAPAHPYTRKLIDCVPILGEPERSLSSIPGLPPSPGALPEGCAFAERCEHAAPECRDTEPPRVTLPAPHRHVLCHHPLTHACGPE